MYSSRQIYICSCKNITLSFPLNLDLFICWSFLLIGISFEEVLPKTVCPKSSLVLASAQCQVAATFLGLPFTRSGTWTADGELGGCQSYEEEVYFNSALQVDDSNTVDIGIRAICIKGKDIEHIYTDNNR